MAPQPPVTGDHGVDLKQQNRHCERSEAIHSFFARNDGLLRFARNDDLLADIIRLLAAPFARGFAGTLLPKIQRAQGRPGARCTRGLVCNVHKEMRTRAYRFSGEHPAFPAQWFYGLWRALPGDEFVLSPSSAD